ncbi:hypothetical protein ACJX0J_008281, partial [Zea mays]
MSNLVGHFAAFIGGLKLLIEVARMRISQGVSLIPMTTLSSNPHPQASTLIVSEFSLEKTQQYMNHVITFMHGGELTPFHSVVICILAK